MKKDNPLNQCSEEELIKYFEYVQKNLRIGMGNIAVSKDYVERRKAYDFTGEVIDYYRFRN